MFVSLLMMSLAAPGCSSPPPAVDAVSPTSGKAGETVRVVGENFADGAAVTVGGQPLGALVVRGAATIEGTVPEGLSPGAHDVVVTQGEQSVTAAGAFTVIGAQPVDVGVPCAGEFTAYSTVVTAQEKFVIDRRYKGDESKNTVERIPFREVEGIQYEEVDFEGEVCAAIWIVTGDGRRHLFDDDTEVRLKKRAQEIAVGVGKPIDVVAEIKEEDGEEG